MRHLKRFRTWLGYVYCAALALRQQRDQKNQYRIYDKAAERLPADSLAIDPAAVEFETASPVSTASSETAKPAVDLARPQSVTPAPGKEVDSAVAAEKNGVETAVREPEGVAASVEANLIAEPVPQNAMEPEPAAQPKSPPVAVPRVEHQPEAPATHRPQALKPSTSGALPGTRKYDPAAINDQTAQRLARLLVAEIKLYYASVTNGAAPADSNIYDILKDPIEKSRQHYKQRMGATLTTMPDYFHGELVRSLCAGDASRLGPNYPSTN
jgi:hypothetical protein